MISTRLIQSLLADALPLALLCLLVCVLGCASEVTPLPKSGDVVTGSDVDVAVDGGVDTSGTTAPPTCDDVMCAPGEACQNGVCMAASLDGDGDGFTYLDDCNDLDASVNPGAEDVCDGLDNDCDNAVDEDHDADGDGWATCDTGRGPADCNDDDPKINPGAPELCDGIDNDCDEAIDGAADADGDGFSPCAEAVEQVDCDDTDSQTFPGAAERCDQRDNDCDDEVDEGPACVGCSDGERDELVNRGSWPDVAACRGTFARGSLRQARTGTACGDAIGTPCPVPEDLCAPGWHICMRDGRSADLRFRLTSQDCRALPEIYVAASNNCSNPPTQNPRDASCDTSEPYGCYPTGWCSAPVACGPTETSHCAHAAWPNATRIFGLHTGRTEDNGCGNIASDTSYPSQGSLAGVLCCLD